MMLWSFLIHLTSYGNGILFSTLLEDILLILSLYLISQYIVIPVFKRYRLSRELDRLVGSDSKHWLFGHLRRFTFDEKGLFNLVRNTETFPSIRSSWFGPFWAQVLSYHPDTSISILGSGAPKGRLQYRFARAWLGDGLLTSHGKKWQRNRRLITPAFHYKNLQPYVKVFNECSRTLMKKLEKQLGISIDIHEPMRLMTLDNIMQCAMSSKTNCQTLELRHPYVDAVDAFSGLSLRRMFRPWYWLDWIYYKTAEGRRCTKIVKTLHSFTEKIIQERQDELRNSDSENEKNAPSQRTNKKLLDFLDILLQTKDEDGKGLADTEIREEVDTFLFAGHDTTASAVSWALHNLAKHPELQEKCREEVLSVVGSKQDIEWEDLSSLSYLTMFIKESLRYHSPVAGIGRHLDKPLKLSHSQTPDAVLPAETPIAVRIFVQHRNPNVWDNPTQFDPERFSKENAGKRSPYAFIPFSAGPRNCIGQNFALNEIKVTLAQMIRKFKVYLDEETSAPELISEIVLRSRNGINVKFAHAKTKIN